MFFQRLNHRHCLRQLTLGDAEELFAVVEANRAHLRRWLPWLDRNRTLADCRRFLEEIVQQAETNRNIQAAILFDDRLAGVVSLHRIDWQNRKTAIGYWLAENYQGLGLATASCQALVDHTFAALNLHRIVISCAPGNARSRAIPPRLGFAYEGRERDAEWLYDHFVDHEIYVQLQPDWSKDALRRLVATARPRR